MLALLFAGLSAKADEPRRFKVHPLGFGEPDSTEQAVRVLVSEGGNVVLDRQNGRFLIFATPAEHDRIDDLLAQLNVPPKNVRIEVRIEDVAHGEQRALGARASGGMVVGAKGAKGGLVFKPNVQHRTTDTQSATVQTVTVASGREGAITVGRRVPYLDWLMQYGRRHGIIRGEVQWQEVGSVLLAQATVVGDGPWIAVRLTPTLSGLVDGNPYQLRFIAATTEVTAADGQPFSLGGTAQTREFLDRYLIGFDREGRERAVSLTLTAHIVGPAGK